MQNNLTEWKSSSLNLKIRKLYVRQCMYNIKNSFDIILFFLESKFSKVYNSVGSNSVCELKGLSEFGYPNQRPAGFRRG